MANLDLELIRSIKTARVAEVRRLVAEGADPNGPDASGWTPLDHAAHIGSVSLIKILLELGADINLGFAVEAAALENRLEAVRFLLCAGAKPKVKGGIPLSKWIFDHLSCQRTSLFDCGR